MSFFARLFSSPKAVEDTARSAIRGLDDLVYTEQERDERSERAQEIYRAMWMAAVPSALSRRLIAVIMVATWCLLIVTAVVEHMLGMEDSAQFTLEVLRDVLTNPVNIIVGFYFLKQVVAEYRKNG